MKQKKIVRRQWTEEEIERFDNAYNQYGRQWVKVARKVGTRTIQQVKGFFRGHQTPNKTCITNWTDRESRKFIEAVKMYGKNYKKIAEFVGTRNYDQVSYRVSNLKQLYMKNPSAVPASLHKLIREIKGIRKWSKEENTKFEQGLSKFGRNWVKVASTIKSRT